MSSRAGLRVSAVSGAVVALVAAGRPALAAPVPEIPTDVAAAFGGDALRQTQAADEGLDADFSGSIQAGDIHEVFRFSADFIDVVPTSEPVSSGGQWVGTVRRGDDVLGVVWVVKPEGGPAEWAGASADVVLGAALGTVAATEILIVDEPNGAYYALDGTTVRPLNDWARQALPRPADISTLQETVADQYALVRGQPAEDDVDPPGVTTSLVAMTITLVLGGVLLQRRRHRPGDQSSTRHSPTTT